MIAAVEYWTAKGLAYTAGMTSVRIGTQQYGGVDMYASCINITTGATLFTQQFGTAADDFFNSLVIDTVRGVGYLVGYTSGNAPGYTNFGALDILLVAFMLNNGTLYYYNQIGNQYDVIPSSMVVYPLDNMGYIAGSYNGVAMALVVNLNVDARNSPVIFTTWDNRVSKQELSSVRSQLTDLGA